MLVIGGGASGMMCAITAARAGAKVTVIERNAKIGRKLYITGKGRCNVTNCSTGQDFSDNIVTNARFLYGALARFDSAATMAFFESCGVPLKVERGNRVFPVSDKSSDIIDALLQAAHDVGVQICFSTHVEAIVPHDDVYEVRTDKGVFGDKIVVVATGGMSYSATGSTGDGYAFAETLGHKTVLPVGALVGLRCFGTTSLSGLTLKNVRVSVQKQDLVLADAFGEMLFTHTGVSGPTVLTISSRINRVDISGAFVQIDTKPAVEQDALNERLLHLFAAGPNKQLVNVVHGILPAALLQTWLSAAAVEPRKPVHSVTKEERERLAYSLKHIRYPLLGLEPLDGAVVTAGGVDVMQINPKTMESKLHTGLYFAGEVLDIDALTGGYNLQLAFATGYCAGLAAAAKECKHD